VATTSEKLLADAMNESCPAADPQLIYVPSDPVVQVETQTVYVQPNPVTLSVSGANTAFTPKTLSVAKNTPVTIHFTVTSGTHNFIIDYFNFKVATTTSTLAHDATFTASATGTFQYYSSVGTDKASGMTGTLTVY
jgi:plastocyanin